MSGHLMLDNEMAAAYDRMAPSKGIMDLKRPFYLSNHAEIPAPVMSTINHYLEVADDESVEYDD